MKYWTRSWNTIYGCTKIRTGCLHCWAEIMCRRMQGVGLLDGVIDVHGAWSGKIVYKPERLDMPRHWKKPQIMAVNWMGDMFHKNTPPEVWPAVHKVMAETPQHTYLVLTKRYEEMYASTFRTLEPLDNVYLGATVSCQLDVFAANPPLFCLSWGGWKTWLSFEPALQEIDWISYDFLNGMVCGGESRRNARPMPFHAALGARDYCRAHGIPFTLKAGSQGAPAVLDGEAWFQFPKEVA